MEARALVPGHISTFFVPSGDPRGPPLARGSLGSGFCIEQGVDVRVTAEGPATSVRRLRARGFTPLEVADNGRRVADPRTTRATLARLLQSADPGLEVPSRLRIANAYHLPLGAGFGVSGGCALGAALAANRALRMGLTRGACVAAAHQGEVEALTGLGDVIAQATGGVEARVRAGAPPVGHALQIRSSRRPVVLVSFGPRPTRAFLRRRAGEKRLARLGLACLGKLLEAPSLESSTRLGRSFAQGLGLVSPRARHFLGALGPEALASVAMLGDSVFVLDEAVSPREARRLAPCAFVALTRVEPRAARVLARP